MIVISRQLFSIQWHTIHCSKFDDRSAENIFNTFSWVYEAICMFVM